MTVLTEGVHNLEFFVSEANETRSRAVLLLATAGGVYLSGTVLQYNATNVDYEKFDGTGPAAAIVYHETDATDADTNAVCFVRDIEYKLSKLVVASGTTEGEIAEAVVDLAALGMIARTSD